MCKTTPTSWECPLIPFVLSVRKKVRKITSVFVCCFLVLFLNQTSIFFNWQRNNPLVVLPVSFVFPHFNCVQISPAHSFYSLPGECVGLTEEWIRGGLAHIPEPAAEALQLCFFSVCLQQQPHSLFGNPVHCAVKGIELHQNDFQCFLSK